MLIGVLAAALVLLAQLDRNVVFSGRLLAMTETLASVTDPPGPHQIMVAGGNRYEATVRGGVHGLVRSTCDDLARVTGVGPGKYAQGVHAQMSCGSPGSGY
jgi:hypothetical protein